MNRDSYEKFLKTFANKKRLLIISSLRKGRLNVSKISHESGLNQTTVSHNLNKLKDCGIVDVEQAGRYRYYHLNKETIEPLLLMIDKHVKKNCRRR